MVPIPIRNLILNYLDTPNLARTLETSKYFQCYPKKFYLERKYRFRSLKYWIDQPDFEAIKYKVDVEKAEVTGTLINRLTENYRKNLRGCHSKEERWEELGRQPVGILKVYNYLLERVYINDTGIVYDDMRIIIPNSDTRIPDRSLYYQNHYTIPEEYSKSGVKEIIVYPLANQNGDLKKYQEIGYKIEAECTNSRQCFPKRYYSRNGDLKITRDVLIKTIRHAAANIDVEGIRYNLSKYYDTIGDQHELVWLADKYFHHLSLDLYINGCKYYVKDKTMHVSYRTCS